MKTEVAILHDEYPAKIRDHVLAKTQNLVKYYDGIVSVRAVLDRQQNDHRVELMANVRRGVVLVVDARGDSISTALDDAMERMSRVLSKHKDKLKDTARRKARPRT
jgi:ribosomal subunit interface protein